MTKMIKINKKFKLIIKKTTYMSNNMILNKINILKNNKKKKYKMMLLRKYKHYIKDTK
jgi:hypothetical protein